MSELLQGPFEKFMDWRQCAAVMQREACNSIAAAHSRESTNF
jgi:hypothetical protein